MRISRYKPFADRVNLPNERQFTEVEPPFAPKLKVGAFE